MTLKTVEGRAPSYWASYFINGDDSGMEESEIAAADKFVEWLGACPCSCTSEEDENHPGFLRWHDAAQFGVLAADCSLYTALINEA